MGARRGPLGHGSGRPLKVAIVAEYYPRGADDALGVWAHRQAVAARDAGAEVRVLVLHRPVPSLAAVRSGDRRAIRKALAQPARVRLDGIEVRYVRFLAPPRPWSYGHWGAWAALPLRRALRSLRRTFPYDLVHAHYAAPAGDAVRRAAAGTPYVVSVHGGDVLGVARDFRGGERAVRRAFAEATLVLANSRAIEARSRRLGAVATRVVHLGTDVPPAPAARDADRIVTVANLVARKRHSDVLRALWLLRESHPELRWDVIGDGPERPALERLAGELGVAQRVRFHGALRHDAALDRARAAALFVLPSVDEAFGVAYIEAMAGGVPAIGSIGEPGPQEIAACGDGIRLVPPGDPERLASQVAEILDDPGLRRDLADAARATVLEHFTWERCGRATAEAYEDALRGS